MQLFFKRKFVLPNIVISNKDLLEYDKFSIEFLIVEMHIPSISHPFEKIDQDEFFFEVPEIYSLDLDNQYQIGNFPIDKKEFL